MFERERKRLGAGALLALVGAAALALGTAGSGAAAVPGCGAFKAQGDAQDAFLAAGGNPARNAGGMDPDRDGVACEELPGPFKGFATIGYNRKRQFFYGVVTMPVPPSGGEAACLYGSRTHPDSARQLNVYKVRGGGDKPLLGPWEANAQANPAAGQLIWKIARPISSAAKYYVSFEERVRTSPYGRNPCPGFDSRPTLLPRPREHGGGKAKR